MTGIDLLISGDHVLTMAEGTAPLEGTSIAVKDGRIIDIGPSSDMNGKYKASKRLGGTGKVVMPGLVNTHTHAPMVYLRGLADDLALMDWLQNHIWPAENRLMGAEFVRDATELACLEMLRAGITTFSDMYFFQDEVGKVAEEMGMRAVLCPGVIDFPTATTTGPDDCIAKAESFIEKWKGHDRIRTGIGAHSTFTCCPDTMRKVRDTALKHDALVHVHLSETAFEVDEVRKQHGVTPARLLDDLGLFDARTVAAHCVWLDDVEIDILAQKNVTVAHCVKSNLKLASGIAPVPKMLDKGMKVTLGTDGAASNNRLDILDELSTAAKLHKAVAKDATVLDAETAIRMATTWGSKALGFDDCGTLEVGRSADMIVLDFNRAHLAPLYHVMSHLAYAAQSSDVESVVIGGTVCVEDGKVLVDEETIYEKARRWGRTIAEQNSG